MKTIVADFTSIRLGTLIGPTAKIERCACGRKGSATHRSPDHGPATVTVLHTVSVQRVLGIQLATVDECVTTEPRASKEIQIPLRDIIGETADAHQ